MSENTGRSQRLSLTPKQLSQPEALELLSLLNTATADGRLQDEEVLALQRWLETHSQSTLPAVVYLRNVVQQVLADRRISEEERKWLQRTIERVLPRQERELAIVRRREAAAAAKAKEKEEQEKKLKAKPITTFDFMVAGVAYEGRAEIIRHYCQVGDVVFLVREPTNPFSPNAIKIRLKQGFDIGYVPEVEAKRLAPVLDRGALQSAEIKKILSGGIRPIPVVWGELYEPDANLPDAVAPSQIPPMRTPPQIAPTVFPPQSAAFSGVETPQKRKSSGCRTLIYLLLAILGLLILAAIL